MNETNLNFRTLRDPANAKRDWTEDAGHENGNYLCQCLLCGKEFIGNKRRTVCKLCDGATSNNQGEQLPTTDKGDNA